MTVPVRLCGYHSPRSLEEALDLLDATASRGESAMLLAGGTDIFVRMREGRWQPHTLIQIEALEELRGIGDLGDSIRLGARTSFTDLMESSLIAEHAAVLRLAARDVGAPQIQSRGSIGGQVGTASPVGDLLPGLLALEAEVVCQSKSGERSVPMAQWLRGVGKSDRRPEELVTAVEFPKPPAGTRHLWHKMGPRRAQAISKVCLAGLVTLDASNTVTRAHIAFGAVAPTAIRTRKTEDLLTGKSLTRELIAEARDLVQTEVTPINDLRSTEVYRRQMCGVMLRRGLSALIS